MAKSSAEIAIYSGKFNGNTSVYKWTKLETFSSLEKANYKFHKMCQKYLSYDYEDLIEEFDSQRLDIEIRVGSKMVKWFGLCDKGPIDDEEESEEDSEE